MTKEPHQPENRGRREPVLSIPPGWWPAFSTLFILQVSAVSLIIGSDEIIYGVTGRRFAEVLNAIIDRLSAVPAEGVALSAIEVEIGKTLMVLAQYLRRRLLEPLEKRLHAEGVAEGITQGKAEGAFDQQLKWIDWNRRREDAQKRGLPFDELPPDTD